MADERILIADDDPHILKMLSRVLQGDGMHTEETGNGKEAYQKILSTSYDLILLDIEMEGMDGFSIVKAVRQQGIQTPIVIVTGNTEEYNTIFGLGIGADDYLTKPLRPSILCAKVKALIRRSKSALADSGRWIERGPFRFDCETSRFFKEQAEIALTAKEKQLMLLFLRNINMVFTKEMLYEQIWKDCPVDDNTIMVNIRNIRQKIEDNPKAPLYLKTVWGVGYQLIIP